MSLHVPFRYDYVGSFLRDEELLKARKEYEKEIITKRELTEIEDKKIVELIKKQKELGYHVITDGEFRRKSWHLDFFWGLNGIKKVELSHGYYFHGLETYHTSVQVEGEITGENHPFVEHFKFLKQFEDDDTIAKQTIPAPAQLLVELFREDNKKITEEKYPDYEKLEEDIAKAYKQVIRDLYDAGCRNIQLDDCTWGMLVDSDYIEKKFGGKVSIEEEAKKYLRINNLALEDRPDDLTITTHVCRGNYESTYAASGAYDEIAQVLFAKENVDAFYLEYDDERTGGFEPLKYVSDGKKVVLGLITTKRGELEDEDKIIERINEASKYISLDRLCLSPQCGFSSNENGNKLSFEQQWDKLKLIKKIAEKIWE